MTKAQTTERLNQEVRDAICNADFFTVSLFHNMAYETHLLRTLELARQAAVLMPKARGSVRKAMVYAVTKSGRSVMIPEDFQG
jgi:5-formyltetrahydrofolate cyclo-ligase